MRSLTLFFQLLILSTITLCTSYTNAIPLTVGGGGDDDAGTNNTLDSQQDQLRQSGPQYQDRYSHSESGILLPRSTTAPGPVNQLLQIAPSSNSCTGATFPNECVVSSTSVVHAMVDSFKKYNVTTGPEQAALLSWMAYESGEFKYDRNHFPAPGRPGQGTRVMLMPNFVQEYVNSLPELKGQLTQILSSSSSSSSGNNGNDDNQLNQILALVMPDKYSFAAAAWYYNVHCTADQKHQVKYAGQTGWENAFVKACVGTTVTDDRKEYWTRASNALGVPI